MLESRGLEVMVLGDVYGVEGLLGLWGCPMERRGLLGLPVGNGRHLWGPGDGKALMGEGKHLWDAEGW